MVADLGGNAPTAASAGSFARTLAAQGNSQEALAAGTGPFPPSPAPSSAAVATAPALTSLPALDTTSFGDDAPGDAALTGALATSARSVEQLVQAAQAGLAAPTAALPAAASPLSASLPAGSAGQRALAAAQSALGITEDPPGSNDGPGLAIFRSSVAGAEGGQPWCAYFASWAAQQAGAPVGTAGQGEGSVEGISAWAAQNGRLLPAGTTPSAGNLVLFGGRHVGIVEAVNLDGTLTTVEGNYRNSVQRVRRSPLEATGYVRLG